MTLNSVNSWKSFQYAYGLVQRMLVVQFLFALSLVLWISWIWQRRKFYLLMLKIPGPIGLPLVGMAYKLFDPKEILNILTHYRRIYGKFMYTWIGPYPFLVVADPEIIQQIFLSQNCVNKSLVYDAVDDGIGEGLFSLKNPKWAIHRKLINPSFSHKVLLSFLPIFNRETDSLITELGLYVGCDPQNLTTILQRCSLNIASQTTMGRQMIRNNDKSKFSESLFQSYQILFNSIIQMCTSPWLRFDFIHQFHENYKSYIDARKRIREFVQNLIQEQIENISNEKSPKIGKNIFINQAITLRTNGEFTWKDVEDESNVLVLAAFETTANTVGNVIMLLAMYPEYQEKVYDELRSIFPNKDGNFEINYQDIQNMTYLDMVVNEAMRVMAPVPFVARTVVKNLHLSNGIVLPEGLQIAIDIFNLHRSEEYWGPRATTFNPDNFLPVNVAARHPYAFIPFTKGIRYCIGSRYALLAVKVILGKLLRKYRFTTEFKFDDLQFFGNVTIKLKRVPLLQIHLRERIL